MFHTPRLQAYGFFGQPTFPALTALGDASTVRQAQKRPGAFKNLRLYSDKPIDEQEGQTGKGQTYAGAIGLSYRLSWDTTFTGTNYNAAAAWTVVTGSSGYLANPPQPFNGNIAGLYHFRSVLNTPSAYSGYPLQANQPFSIRLFLFRPPADQPAHIFKLRIGRYQLVCIDGSWSIMRLAEANTDPATGVSQTGWDATSEASLDTLLNQTTISTTDEASIATLRQNIYSDYQSLSLESTGENAYGQAFTLTFIPAPSGRLFLIANDTTHIIENTDILKTREDGILWPAS